MKFLKTYECSGQKLSNSFCQFWNNKSITLQTLYPSSVVRKIIPLFFLAQTVYTLLNRSPLKWKFFRLSNAQVKICQIFFVNFETTSRFLSKFCIPLQFHERLFLCTFLAQTIYILLKRSPLKWNFWRLTSAQVKSCQIPSANFETTSQLLSKLCIPLQLYERLFLCSF